MVNMKDLHGGPGTHLTHRDKILANGLSIWFGEIYSLKSLNLKVMEHEILGIIGPANSGKTSFLRALNRLNDLQPAYRQEGFLTLDGQELQSLDIQDLRRRVGMVFALPMTVVMFLYLFFRLAYILPFLLVIFVTNLSKKITCLPRNNAGFSSQLINQRCAK